MRDSGKFKTAITYRSALELIACNCLRPLSLVDGQRWWDTGIAPNDIDADLVAEGVGYLENQGLLIRCEQFHDWIQIVDTERETM